MPLDANLRSQYQHLANDYLYNFPVRSVTEFPLVIRALEEVHYDFSMGSAYRMAKKARGFFSSFASRSSSSVTPGVPTLSTEIKTRISSLEVLLSSPGMYVASSSNHAEYRRIVLSCVGLMQKRLQGMTPEEQGEYVEEQSLRRQKITAQKEFFSKAKAPLPGDEASTISLEIFVAEKAIKVFKEKNSVKMARLVISDEYAKANSTPGEELTRALREQLLAERLYVDEVQGENLVNRLSGKRRARVVREDLVTSQEVVNEFIREGVPPPMGTDE